MRYDWRRWDESMAALHEEVDKGLADFFACEGGHAPFVDLLGHIRSNPKKYGPDVPGHAWLMSTTQGRCYSTFSSSISNSSVEFGGMTPPTERLP